MSCQYLIATCWLYHPTDYRAVKDAHTVTFHTWAGGDSELIISPPVYASHHDPLIGISEPYTVGLLSFEEHRERLMHGGDHVVQFTSVEEVIDCLNASRHANKQQLISLFIRWFV